MFTFLKAAELECCLVAGDNGRLYKSIQTEREAVRQAHHLPEKCYSGSEASRDQQYGQMPGPVETVWTLDRLTFVDQL